MSWTIFFFSLPCEFYFFQDAGGLIGFRAYENEDDVGAAHSFFRLFFPVFFGGSFLQRVIDDFEGADGVFGLADEEVLQRFVFVVIEANEYFF